MNPSVNRVLKVVLTAVVLLLVAVGAYFVGRRSANPPPIAAPSAQSARSGEAPSPQESGETGVIKFDEDSLRLAGLKVAPVEPHALPTSLAVTGAVDPNQAGVVRVTPRVGGKLVSLQVNVGDAVRAGQTLATLSSLELAQAQAAYRLASARVAAARSSLDRQRQLARLGTFGQPRVEDARSASATAQGAMQTAENEVAGDRAEVIEAESEIKVRQAALTQAQTQVGVVSSRLERANLLLKEQLISTQEWEQTQADKQRAEADIEAARAAIAEGQAKMTAAKSRVAVAQAKLDEARRHGDITTRALTREQAVYQGGYLSSKEVVEAEAALQQAGLDQNAAAESIRLVGGTLGGGNILTITAPIAGRVTERLVTLGETVTPEKLLLTIINLRSVWVQFNVYQRDVASIHTGQPVTVTSDAALGEKLSGTVAYIGDIADAATRTVTVRCVIQNDAGHLRPETFVKGTITTGTQRQVLAVPRDAVQTQEGKTVVFVQTEHEGEFRAREVETGNTSGDQTPITSGLKPGEKVVVKGAFLVKAQAMKSKLGEHD
jgi:cobalt-zinc-cadmium efflux system membrane fusion protein